MKTLKGIREAALTILLIVLTVGAINYVVPSRDDRTRSITVSSAILRDTCIGQECHAYLSDTIDAPDKYTVLVSQIQEAQPGDVIHIHLQGMGGRADTINYMANFIAQTKGTVITHVDGDVASAHAFIAMLGTKVEIGHSTSFMFHYPAILNPLTEEYVSQGEICDIVSGKDRGVSAQDNCKEEMRVTTQSFQKLFDAKIKPYLTDEELARYNMGYQVWVSGDDMAERIKTWKT